MKLNVLRIGNFDIIKTSTDSIERSNKNETVLSCLKMFVNPGTLRYDDTAAVWIVHSNKL